MSDDPPVDVILPVNTLREFVGTFLPLVSEARLHFREDELYAEAINASTVVLVNQWLDDGAAESWWATGVTVGVNLERLDDYLTKTDDDLAHIRFDMETRTMEIDAGRSSFTMATIDPDAIRESQTRDDMGAMEGDDMTTDVTLDAAAFAHAVDLVDMVSDHVVVASDPDADAPVTVYGEGDTDDVSITFEESLHEGSTVDAETESIYSQDYLSDLVDPIPSDAALRVRTGDEWPMALDYGWENGHGTVAALISPRIQTR